MDIDDIHRLFEAERFSLSDHAASKIVERNILRHEIIEAGSTSEIIEDYPDDKYSPSCLLFGLSGGGRPLHIQICYTEMDLLKIITTYEPNPAKWLSFRVRRSL